MATIHSIGEPENESERKALRFFRGELPAHYHVFHNLELATPAGMPCEYDQIVVGDHAVYVVEVKGYRGYIQGNKAEWTLSSGRIVPSPIPLTNKKARVLAAWLRRFSDALERVWIDAAIVLTCDDAQVDLDDDQAYRVLHLEQALRALQDPGFPQHTCEITPSLRDVVCRTVSDRLGPLRPRNEIREYRVMETIGQNDLYTLYLAEHQELQTGKRFALKVYTLDAFAAPAERQRQEDLALRSANALDLLPPHRNIVDAHPPFFWDEDKIVLPLDWAEGPSLRGLLSAGVEMSLERKLDIVRQAGDGLRHAHRHGVIHRNLQPENIIVPNQGPVKLVNFDCARIEGDAFHTIGSRVSARLDKRYAAPEIWVDAHAVSALSDQYALGAILFELITGQPICEHSEQVDNAGGLPFLPCQINPSLSQSTDRILSQMCAYHPEKRYANVKQALRQLRHIKIK